MKTPKCEFIQRIESHYVGDDCIQLMVPFSLNKGITILNSEGMLYHYKPNSELFINKYIFDKRREQFPYFEIPIHESRIKLKIIEYVNQLLDFNRVYIEIENDIVKEYYVVKDGEEALLAIKYIIPNQEETKYMTRDEVSELLKTANGGIFGPDGGISPKPITLSTEASLLEWYKESLIQKRENEQAFFHNNYGDKDVNEFFFRNVNKMTIDDVPADIPIFANYFFIVSLENNEIKSIKAITIKFMGPNNYKVESYDFPITIYSLENIRNLEQTNSIKTSEPKFPRHLNKTINKSALKRAKRLIFERKRNQNSNNI